jgi:hypothetical protein
MRGVMRRGLIIAIAAAIVMAVGSMAEAQSPRRLWRLQQQQMQQYQPPPRFDPGMPAPGGLPPSAAARQALEANPGARILGVRRNNSDYVVTLRQRGAVRRVIIPGM